jgi:murein DD-endopeptidase MepM/ murein hydrolase activator NlpD
MSRGGRLAHAVPAQAARRTSTQRVDGPVTSRVAMAVFVAAVIGAVIAIVVAAPQHAGPGAAGNAVRAGSGLPAGLVVGPGLPAGDWDPRWAVDDPDDMAGAEEGRGSAEDGEPPGAASTSDVPVGDTSPAHVDALATTDQEAGRLATVEPEELTGYRWPKTVGRLTSFYDYRSTGFLVLDGRRIHEGIDIASFCGAAVRAAHRGTVLAAGRDFAHHVGFSDSLEPFYQRLRRRGEMNRLPITVVIDDGNGYRSVYAHLASASVKRGQTVKRGEVIGTEGATGNATGCHLHYELIRMDGPWMRVAPDRVRRERYPAWVRERVDPLRVLSLDDPKAPRRVPGVVPPRPSLRATESGGPDG